MYVSGHRSERSSLSTIAAIFVATMVVLPSQALADRPPTAEEREKIEATLKAEGFVTWQEIEFDDGRFEVDDARHRDGGEYDLELDAKTFAIVKRERDD